MVGMGITSLHCSKLIIRQEPRCSTSRTQLEARETQSTLPGMSLTGRSNLSDHYKPKQHAIARSCENQYKVREFGKYGKEDARKTWKNPEGWKS